jgi:hypothetical protein
MDVEIEKEKGENNYDSDTTQKNLNLGSAASKENNVTNKTEGNKSENIETRTHETDKKKAEDEKENVSIEADNSQGLVLRSKFLSESSTIENYGAVDVYSNFKKLNITDFPNIHRKL